MRLVIIGPQGSGKGTQANLLSSYFSVPHGDVGQLLRDEVAKGTMAGVTIKGRMDEGRMVPDGIVTRILEKWLKQKNSENGFILDGFPRDLKEARFFEKTMDIDKVIVLEVNDDVAVKRLSNRWQCQKCNLIYGGELKPKKKGLCDACGRQLVRRADDSPGAVRKRLKLYHEKTVPVIGYFKRKNKVVFFDASQSVKKVFNEIVKSLAE